METIYQTIFQQAMESEERGGGRARRHWPGGSFVVLSPEGFPDRWHPSRAKEKLCAEGRMLFLSLWPPEKARLDNATLHRRCHEMGDLLFSPD